MTGRWLFCQAASKRSTISSRRAPPSLKTSSDDRCVSGIPGAAGWGFLRGLLLEPLLHLIHDALNGPLGTAELLADLDAREALQAQGDDVALPVIQHTKDLFE